MRRFAAAGLLALFTVAACNATGSEEPAGDH
jgi:hypothetical protein